MPKILLPTLILLIFVQTANAGIIITEIMANPIADEYLNEWIELYNNGTEKIDVAGWVIEDDNKKNTITGGLYHGNGTFIQPFSYAIITDSATRVYDNFKVGNAARLYVKNLGLSNKGETIKIYDSSFKLVDEVRYEETGNGFSWAFDEIWQEAEPTPGSSNLLEFGCDFKVEILLNETLFFNDTEFKIVVSRVRGEKANITLDREIKDVHDKTIKRYDTLFLRDVSSQRTFNYKPELENIAVVTANISSMCDDNKENDFDSKFLFKMPKENPEINLTNNSYKTEESKVIYESENYKIKRFAIFFFSGLLLLVVCSLLKTQK